MEIYSGTLTKANNKIVGEKSVLDYVIVSDELIRYIKNMQIDTAKVEYSKIPSQSKSDREILWNFNHPEGWGRFHKYTSTSNSLSDCWNDISGVETSYEK